MRQLWWWSPCNSSWNMTMKMYVWNHWLTAHISWLTSEPLVQVYIYIFFLCVCIYIYKKKARQGHPPDRFPIPPYTFTIISKQYQTLPEFHQNFRTVWEIKVKRIQKTWRHQEFHQRLRAPSPQLKIIISSRIFRNISTNVVRNF